MNEQQNQFMENEQQDGGVNVQPEAKQQGFVQSEGQVQQPEEQMQQPEMMYTSVPDDLEVQKKSKKKKAMTITALIVAIFILIGGTSVGVWAFMSGKGNNTGLSSNDPKANATGNIFQYMNKISQAKKIESKFDSDGEMTIELNNKAQKVKFGIESGAFQLERSTNDEKPNNFFDINGTIRASADSDDYQIKNATKMINGEKVEASLSGDMVFKWSALGQSKQQALYGENKKQAQAFLMLNGENQESAREMRDFLLKGYDFKISKSGDETIMTFNKSDLKAVTEKVEENIKNDQNKFKELYFKTTKDTSEKTFNDVVKHFLEHEMSKGVETDVLPNLHDFEYKISYKDKGDRIEEKSELKLDLSVQGIYKVNFNLKATTTYIV